MRPSEKAMIAWLVVLLVGLIDIALVRCIPSVAHADSPLRVYPERVACGGIIMVYQYADRYETETLSACPYPTLIGAPWFIERNRAALGLLAQYDAGGLALIERNVGQIRQESRWSGVNPPEEPLGIIWTEGALGFGGLAYYASTLVHEAQHLEDYRAYRVWWGAIGERAANDRQAESLEAMRDLLGEDAWLIGWLRSINHGEWSTYPTGDFRVRNDR